MIPPYNFGFPPPLVLFLHSPDFVVVIQMTRIIATDGIGETLGVFKKWRPWPIEIDDKKWWFTEFKTGEFP